MKILISLLVLFYSIVGFAQSAESVLKSLQNKFDSISDLSADVNQKSMANQVYPASYLSKKKTS